MMSPYRSRLLFPLICLSIFFSTASAAEPLHVRIDAVLEKSQIGPSAPLADDAEFLRRIFLDLTGRIPSTQAARKFLDDKSPDKRQRLIDELAESPANDRHLAKVFDVMFMQRRPDKHVKAAEWDAYLLASMKANKPYNQLAREILAADGADPKLRAPVKFYLDREDMAVNLVTRDTARVFFGRDVECAQCHDHPLISDYEQSEYYGLLAFLNRSSLFRPDKKKPAVLQEKAEGVVNFKSVFTGDEGATRPRLPGESEITEPTFNKGDEYKIKPAKNVRPVPKYSRRAKFAELATAGTNAAFNKNIANRLWAVMMGRGLVEPVDLHHSENPPASPELLKLLSDEFVAMKFNTKAFIKEIALSRTYQRSFRMPDSFAENLSIATKQLPQLQAELARHNQRAESFDKPMEDLGAAIAGQNNEAKPFREKVNAAQKELAALAKKHNAALAALTKLQAPLAAKREVAKLLEDAAKQAGLAAQKLPADKALAKASAAITAQSQTRSKQVAALQKGFDQQTAAAKKAETDLAAKQTQANQIQAELAKKVARIDQADAKRRGLRGQQEAALEWAAAVQRRIDDASLLKQLMETSQKIQIAKSALKSLPAQLTAAQAQATQKTAALAKSQQQQAAVKKTHAETTKSLVGIKETLANHTGANQLLAEASAQLEAARKQLPKDQQLAAVATQLATAQKSQTDQQSAIDQQMKDMETQVAKSAAELSAVEKTMAELTAALKKSQQTAAQLASRQKELGAEQTKAEGVLELAETELTASWTKHFRVAEIEHLSPEPLAWSVLEAVGQVELQQKSALAAWNKKHADLAKKELTLEQKAEQADFIEQTVEAKLKGQIKKFLPLFAASSGQPQHEFFATVDQALFFSNGNDVLAWLRPSGENLTARLGKLTEPQKVAEELYLSVLTRRPTAEETQDVTAYLAQRKDEKPQALQEMAWALLTSAEFRFEH